MHYAGAHRVHRCAVRSCDVDPEVKRPRLPGDARVVEVAANRVGSVERLQRPGVHTASIPPTHSGARHVGRGRLPRVVRTRAGVSLRGASRRRAPSPPQTCYVACLSHNVWGLPRSVTDTRGSIRPATPLGHRKGTARDAATSHRSWALEPSPVDAVELLADEALSRPRSPAAL